MPGVRARKIVLFMSLGFLALPSCRPGDERHEQVPSMTDEGFFKGDGGVRLFYRKVPGPGSTVVVIHGGPGVDSAYLEPDLEPLSSSRTIVYYDQRGGGRSDLVGDEVKLSIDHHVRDLERLRQHLGLERMSLLAHSFGPILAAMYAIAHPERVERMIFIGPLPPRRADIWERFQATVEDRLTPDEQERMGEAYSQLLEGPDTVASCQRFWSIALKPRLADPDSTGIVKGNLCAAPAKAIRHGMGVTNRATMASLGDWDLRADLAAVSAPTLVIHGEQEAIPMDLVEEWTIALPNARLLRVPDAAHFPYVERPDLVWPEIERFLAGD
jgi:proline iminopeptidase